MAEIMTPLTPLTEGAPHVPGADEVVITPAHTISDILRYAASQCGSSGADELKAILGE
jgi:hypothetical protein